MLSISAADLIHLTSHAILPHSPEKDVSAPVEKTTPSPGKGKGKQKAAPVDDAMDEDEEEDDDEAEEAEDVDEDEEMVSWATVLRTSTTRRDATRRVTNALSTRPG